MAAIKSPMKNKLSLFLFCSILVLAASIRLFRLDTLISPYWEEVALGYDAYSISETGKDHHGNSFPLVAFESFGDWKPSAYFYAIVPFIKILDLGVMAVRLPSALAGIAIVIGIYVLLKQILPTSYLNRQPYLPHLGMFVAAISPWAIIFSRSGWEVNFATALITWGVIVFFSFLKEKNYKMLRYITSIILLCLAMYTYHSTRVIAPLIGIMLIATWFSVENHSLKFISSCKNFFGANFVYLIAGLALTITLISPFLLADSSITSQRFKETSIFSDLSVIEKSNEGQLAQTTILGKLFYHRYLLFGLEITKNYFTHFNLDFLFLSGDSNPRHSTRFFGQLYHIEAIFLFLSLAFLSHIFRKTIHNDFDPSLKPYWLLILGWFLISILPASITYGTPHALRILPSLPVWIILITVGISQISTYISQRYQKIFFVVVVFIYLIEFAAFWRFYTNVYPKKYANEWQYGYEQLISSLNEQASPTTQIFVTREQGRPAMYLWFYSKTDPRLIQASNSIAKQDQGEFLEFQNFHFVRTLNEANENQDTLVAGSKEQLDFFQSKTNKELKIINEIKNYNGELIWQIGRIL